MSSTVCLSSTWHTCQHGGVNIIVKGSSLWIIRPSSNFMDLALCPWSFPDTMTSQSLTLLSVMNHSIPEQALALQGLMGVCNSDTIPGKGWTDLLCHLSSIKFYTSLREAKSLLNHREHAVSWWPR